MASLQEALLCVHGTLGFPAAIENWCAFSTQMLKLPERQDFAGPGQGRVGRRSRTSLCPGLHFLNLLLSWKLYVTTRVTVSSVQENMTTVS